MTEAAESDTLSSRIDVWKMFDRIAHRYDILNRLLSFGRDMAWRKKMMRHLPDRNGLKVLDLATGTADQLIALAQDQRVEQGLGIDLSEKMLDKGREKIACRGQSHRLTLASGDAMRLQTESLSIDVATISFGIRNVLTPTLVLAEMFRVLRPGGRALILEFSLPSQPMLQRFYLCYFRYLLPRIGGLVSGDTTAYPYLNRTVESFPHGHAFCQMMREVGFERVEAHPLTFGIASIYQGDKAKDADEQGAA